MEPNGSRFNGWLLNTVENGFQLLGDFDGDGRSELFVSCPWSVGVLNQNGNTYSPRMLKPNGTRFGGCLLNMADNVFGPVGDFDGDGDGAAELLVTSPWGLGMLSLTGDTFAALMMVRSGTRFGGWLLSTSDNRF